jgi:hypothetical protein
VREEEEDHFRRTDLCSKKKDATEKTVGMTGIRKAAKEKTSE